MPALPSAYRRTPGPLLVGRTMIKTTIADTLLKSQCRTQNHVARAVRLDSVRLRARMIAWQGLRLSDVFAVGGFR